MAGYDRQIVVDAVQDELDRTTDGEDRKFDEALVAYQSKRKNQDKVAARAVQLVADLDAAVNAGEWSKAKEIGVELMGDRWNRHGALEQASTVGKMPFRVRSARERSLQRVVDVIGSSDQATVSVADLRSWGVFDFVKYTKDAC